MGNHPRVRISPPPPSSLLVTSSKVFQSQVNKAFQLNFIIPTSTSVYCPPNEANRYSSKPKEKDYKLFDGGGLYLLVKTNGGKYWRLKCRIYGKEKLLAIGIYPTVTLADA